MREFGKFVERIAEFREVARLEFDADEKNFFRPLVCCFRRALSIASALTLA